MGSTAPADAIGNRGCVELDFGSDGSRTILRQVLQEAERLEPDNDHTGAQFLNSGPDEAFDVGRVGTSKLDGLLEDHAGRLHVIVLASLVDEA